MDRFGLSEENWEQFIKWVWDFAPNVISAVLILVVGLWLTGLITGWLRRFFKRKDYDEALEKFILQLTNWGLKIVVFVLVITQFGVQTSSLVAILGAAGLAIGLALQGSLSNFAGGVLILLFRPFRVGDFIEAQGVSGTVKEISIFTTKLLTFGNQEAILPNGKLSNDNIINYSSEDKRRDKINIGISYDSDIKLAKDILTDLVKGQENILEDPAPQIVVDSLGDSAVVISVRFWALNEHFWDVHFYTMEEAKTRLEEKGISIPFPQHDVHLYKMDK
ncbi:mechanosensitive ion channel family protein [Aquimarina brevivitae]|uniref:Small conductance mechanosensitive channel n=1 Tax=Aquimarina brevivitae TaxID=323412 RepID=A0A4Q7NY58_9FLAO|nr:mechanosensitive ion channel domain-containing protein [Aquimarina brevivitae]RZS92177.1 small conductance mechanosensitive channel [Aquimarina brevivitae]